MNPKLAEWHIYGNEQQSRFSVRKPESTLCYLDKITDDEINNTQNIDAITPGKFAINTSVTGTCLGLVKFGFTRASAVIGVSYIALEKFYPNWWEDTKTKYNILIEDSKKPGFNLFPVGRMK